MATNTVETNTANTQDANTSETKAIEKSLESITLETNAPITITETNTSEAKAQEAKLEPITIETNGPTIITETTTIETPTETTTIETTTEVEGGIAIHMEPAALSFGDIIRTVTKPIEAIINVPVDITTRVINVATGKMNNDINDNNGRQTSLGFLTPGDILIKRGGGEWDTALIQFAQTFLNRFNHIYEGASKLSHAAVYIGNGEIAEAISEGIVKHYLEDYRNYDWHVIRVKDDRIRNEIVSQAHQCIGAKERGRYGHHVLLSAGLNLEAWEKMYGKDTTRNDLEKLNRGEALAMICVEFVVFCIVAACIKLGKDRIVTRSQSNITPAELYIEMRNNNNDYEYMGKIPQH